MHDVGLRVKVRDVDAHARFAGNATDLVDARGRIGFVAAAHMRDVDAAGPGDRRTQCRDLLRVREDPRNVIEAGREPDRTLAHSRFDQGDHLRTLRIIGRRLRSPAHLPANGSCGNQVGEVQPRPPVDRGEVSGDAAARIRWMGAIDRREILTGVRPSPGAYETPSCPAITVVTPCRSRDRCTDSSSMRPSACEWVSTKPGSTSRPRQSMTRSSGLISRSRPR